MTAPIRVETRELSKRYGALVALQPLSLQVPAGEILALVGPNGAGKTTALRLLVGVLQATSGSAHVAGFDVQRQAREARRRMAFLPDQPFLYEQLTVGELLGFIAAMYRVPEATLRQRADELLPMFGLQTELARRIGQLSFGMRSRLVLLVSLLHDPDVLIMDEPFFGLDPQTLRLIKELLRGRAARGMTVILSTHQLPVVEDLAHRVAILGHGRLLALGSLAELARTHGRARLEELFFHLTT